MERVLFDFPSVTANIKFHQVEKGVLPLNHFPSTLHALIWRNWYLVPLERMAKVARTTQENILQIGTTERIS